MRTWKRFLAAVSFLTRLPVPASVEMDGVSLAASPPMFPVVGALIGATLVGFDRLACAVLPLSVAAVVDLAALFLLTGGLHLDGLMDTADGVFSGKPPERILEIMRDSRVGAMGVTAGIFVIGLKAAALSSLTGISRVQALLLAPACGRYALQAGIAWFPYARSTGGLGSLFQGGVGTKETVLSGLVVLAFGTAMAGARGTLASALAIALALLVARGMARRLDGLTGDVYGALCELAEAAVYLAFAARWPA